MENKKPELSIICPVLNCIEMTQKMINSIEVSEPFNLIIVDNGSSEDYESYLRKLAKENNVEFEFIDGDTVKLTEEEKAKSENPSV